MKIVSPIIESGTLVGTVTHGDFWSESELRVELGDVDSKEADDDAAVVTPITEPR